MNRVITFLVGTTLLLSSAVRAESPDDITKRDYYWNALKAHLNLERFFPANSLFFIGDSLVQNLDISLVDPSAVNLGIGGDSTVGVLHRIKRYKSLKKARAFVFEVGVNDMGLGKDNDDTIALNYKKIFKELPPRPIFLLALFPVNEKTNHGFLGYNERISRINGQLSTLCNHTQTCSFIDLHRMLTDSSGDFNQLLLRENDAIHYNQKGALLIIGALRKRLPLK